MEKKPRDTYRVSYGYGISGEQIHVLCELYLPVIGRDAFALYLVLVSEGHLAHMQETHQRLLSLLDLNIEALENAFAKLEEYMLLRTYLKENDRNNAYIYVLNAPLNAQDFLANGIYMARYEKYMEPRQSEGTVSRFASTRVSTAGYKDITRAVTNFREQPARPSVTYQKVKPAYSFAEGDQEIDFDYEHFVATTSTLVFPAELRSREAMSLIGRLGTVYGLSADRMRINVSRCVNLKTMELDTDKLRLLCEKSKPDVKPSRDPYALSPVSFLQSKQNGAMVSATDKRILEHLSLDMHFSNEVINVMMEYILSVSDNRIAPRFVDMVAGEWARDGISTKEQALAQAARAKMQQKRYNRTQKIDMPDYMNGDQNTDKAKASAQEIEAFRALQKKRKD
jgi:replication initiation and membrane attachment protein